MPSLFTRIIEGELPARFVWKDAVCVAFLSINPLQPGHVLVVPRREVVHWIDLDETTAAHLMRVAQAIGRALQDGFHPVRIGLMVVGLEVHHVHLHVVPIRTLRDMDFDNADPHPDPAALDAAARTVRDALRARGCAEVSE